MHGAHEPPALQLAIGRSRRLAAFVLAAHLGGALAAGLCNVLPVSARIAAALVAVGSLVPVWRAHVTRAAPSALVAIRCTRRGEWQAVLGSGETVTGEPAPASLVHPACTLLALRTASRGVLHAVVLPDAVDARAFRALRARLRTG